MKSSPQFLNKLVLLVTTMLFTPALAAAQTEPPPPPADETAAPADEPMDEDGGAEIVVRGRFIPAPMQQTSEVASFLTSADLARQGDANAAAALTRVTGLSVVSGRFVYVRGLGDRYSSALLNGSPLPSPEPLRRQVPLDLFPSNILDGAAVQKTFSPNYPGEFGGGIIDLRTLRLPSEPFLTLKIGGGGIFYYGESSDWTGISDGTREIPAPLAAAIGTNRRVNLTNFTAAQLEQIGESLTNSPLTVLQSDHLDPDFEGEVTAGTSIDVGAYNIGLVGVVGYSNEWRTQRARRVNVTSNAIDTDTDVVGSTQDIVLNAFGSASVSTEDHEIALTGFLVRSTTKDAEQGVGFDADLPVGVTELTESTAWYERQLGSLQIAGEHTFGALDLEWRTAFAQSTRDAPYERNISYQVVNNVATYTGNADGNATRFSELTDEVFSAGVDGAYTIPLSEERDLVQASTAPTPFRSRRSATWC